MYTIEEVVRMYDNKNQEIYKSKVEEYFKKYTEMFESDGNLKSVKMIAEDSDVMNLILTKLHEGNITEALELIYNLDTLVREYLLGAIIDIKDMA